MFSSRKVWVEDPDGNAWEVFVVKADAQTMGRGSQPVGQAACCAPNVAQSGHGDCCG